MKFTDEKRKQISKLSDIYKKFYNEKKYTC